MERIQAYCHQVGASAERGSFAFGSPLFVAISGIASAIGNGIQNQETYDRCMTYHGFVRSEPGAVAPTSYRPEPTAQPEPRYEVDQPETAARGVQPVRFKRYRPGG